jgi:hypothetical protein
MLNLTMNLKLLKKMLEHQLRNSSQKGNMHVPS